MVPPVCSFLERVPIEIRQRIYEEVLAPDVAERNAGGKHHDPYSALAETKPGEYQGKHVRYDLAIFLVNKQFHNEATEVFCRTDPLVRITVPPGARPPLIAVPTLFWGYKALTFMAHTLQVTFEGDVDDPSWPKPGQYSVAVESLRHYIIRAVDLPLFVSACLCGEWNSTLGVSLRWGRGRDREPVSLSLSLCDPARKVGHLDYFREAPQISIGVQRRLLLPFAELTGMQDSEEYLNKLLRLQVPTSINVAEDPYRGTISIEVLSGALGYPDQDIVDELFALRAMPFDPKPRLARAEKLIAEGDRWLEADDGDAAIQAYYEALAAMDIVLIPNGMSGDMHVSRTWQWNIMLGELIEQDNDPAFEAQNVSADGTVFDYPLYPFQHWRLEGICPDENGRWNHAAWERERLRVVVTSRVIRALHRSDRVDLALAWAMEFVDENRSCIELRYIAHGKVWAYSDPGSTVEEAHPLAPGASALGEIYFRAAVIQRSRDFFELSGDLLRVALFNLRMDTKALVVLYQEFREIGRGWFPTVQDAPELEDFQGSSMVLDSFFVENP